MPGTMAPPRGRRQGAQERRIWVTKPPRQPWLIILNISSLSNKSDFLLPGCIMRSISGLLAGMFICAASAAFADSRVFIIANQADGYGVDQCLAKGEKCGAHAAQSYCRSRDFTEALSYRRVDPDEVTGSVPKEVGGNCHHAGCNEFVAITCQR